MILSVERAKSLIDFNGWTDEKIEMKLKAVEQTIRAYTNNNFQKRTHRRTADIVGGLFVVEALNPFNIGDTVQISESALNCGLYTVTTADDSAFMVVEDVEDESNVLCTKVEYPADVIDCAVNLLEWEVHNRSKVGIQSETLSRHSVTYFNMDGDNSVMGYPKSLLGCLKPYKKARC
jgi:hypothetical protein